LKGSITRNQPDVILLQSRHITSISKYKVIERLSVLAMNEVNLHASQVAVYTHTYIELSNQSDLEPSKLNFDQVSNRSISNGVIKPYAEIL